MILCMNELESSPTESSDLCEHGNFKNTCPSCKAIQEGRRGQPFAKELMASRISPFQELRGDSEYVVRSAAVDNREKTIEKEKQGKLLFQELEQTYGIPVAATHRVIGHGKFKNEVAYTMTRKVSGKNLRDFIESDRVELTEEIKNKIETHFQSLVRYLIDRYKDKKTYLQDIYKNEQYVIGKYSSGNQNEQEIYLVDIDPVTREERNGNAKYFHENLEFDMTVLVRGMVRAEKKVGKQFSEPRQLLKDFFLSVSKELPESIAGYLNLN